MYRMSGVMLCWYVLIIMEHVSESTLSEYMISFNLIIQVSSGSRSKIILFMKAWLENWNVLKHIFPSSSNESKKQVSVLFEKRYNYQITLICLIW